MFEAASTELNEALTRLDGAELYRSQGRAQAVRGFLGLESAARAALTPLKAPARPTSTDFGQRDNPHFQ